MYFRYIQTREPLEKACAIPCSTMATGTEEKKADHHQDHAARHAQHAGNQTGNKCCNGEDKVNHGAQFALTDR